VGLRGNSLQAHRLEHQLGALPGVHRVHADPRSGRVLLAYQPGCDWVDSIPGTSALPHGATVSQAQDKVDDSTPWHSLSMAEVLLRLGVAAPGLDGSEVLERRRRFGANALPAPESRSRLATVYDQIANLPTGLLLGSSFLSALGRDYPDAAAILSTVGLNTAIGYGIERKNEDLLESWRRLEAGQVQVVRQGHIAIVDAADLVPGDVLVLRAGDTVPADGRVIEAHRLSCSEALLTGESEAQRKAPPPVAAATPLAERTSMVFSGTTVVAGHGRAVVTSTGRATQAAQVRALIEAQPSPPTPLERRLSHLSNQLAVGGLSAGAAAATLGLLWQRPVVATLRGAIALAVAAIPEGLPVVTTATLVRSMQRMRERGMVVRRLAAAETLGGVTVVCTDKTGTLTRNEMQLEVVDVGGEPLELSAIQARPQQLLRHPPTLALAAALLNSDVDVQRHGDAIEVAGSSTERALVDAATRAGLDRSALRRSYPRRVLHERDAEVHYVISLHDTPQGGRVAFVKGAPEQVLALCDSALEGRLSPAGRRTWLARNDAMASSGLRVLALAWQRLPRGDGADVRSGYTFIGLVGLRDPLRAGAVDAIRDAGRAGIRTVILTGDQRRTAEAIARELGVHGETVDGREVLDLLRADGEAARRRLDRVAVFSRVTPADKVAIVEELRRRGEIVAMAGDGINDAPALKAADVGIAIGVGATDVARQSADIVLASDDLRSILSAVGEGRVVQDNLRRALRYLVATNLSEVTVSLAAAAVGARESLTAMQLLWINLISDTLPALALALEPAPLGVLDRPPAPPHAPLLDAAAQRRVARDGLAIAAFGGLGHWIGGPALAFANMAGAELGYVAVCRPRDVAATPRFLALTGGAVALQLAALSVPPLRVVLGLHPVPSLAEFVGFGVGFIAPWVFAQARGDDLIRRRGVYPVTNPRLLSQPFTRLPSQPLRGGTA